MILTTKKAAHIAKFAEFVWFVWLCSNVQTVECASIEFIPTLDKVLLNKKHRKGQIISKCLFEVFYFFQKRTKTRRILVKTFVFGRIRVLTICFRN